jgi:hypothetical protein
MLQLRSWVQLPPSPFLSARELRYCFELVLGGCRAEYLAMLLMNPIEGSLTRCLKFPSSMYLLATVRPVCKTLFNIISFLLCCYEQLIYCISQVEEMVVKLQSLQKIEEDLSSPHQSKLFDI